MHSLRVFTCLTLILMAISQQIWDVVSTLSLVDKLMHDIVVANDVGSV